MAENNDGKPRTTDAVSLRDYIDKCVELIQGQIEEKDRRYSKQFLALELLTSERDLASTKAVGIAMQSADKANDKASLAVEKRLEAANEWRDAMNDREKKFAPQTEVDIKFSALQMRIDAIEKQTVLSAGERKGISSVGATIFAAISSLAAVVAIIVSIIVIVRSSPLQQAISAPPPATIPSR